MMSTTEIAAALSFLITALIGFAFFYWVWQQYVIDSTRQQLFELRDQLFDLATDGSLNRKSEQYELLRALLNKSIRYADELDVVRLTIFIITAKLAGVRNLALPTKHFAESIRKIKDEKVRGQVNAILEKKSKILMWHIYRRSLLLLILVPVVVFFLSFVMVSIDWIGRTGRKLGILVSESVTYAEA
jgi:hypothetical protein